MAGWLTLEEKRDRFIEWIDAFTGLKGNWLRDTQLGLEIRIQLYFEKCLETGWKKKAAEGERDRLLASIEKFEEGYP